MYGPDPREEPEPEMYQVKLNVGIAAVSEEHAREIVRDVMKYFDVEYDGIKIERADG